MAKIITQVALNKEELRAKADANAIKERAVLIDTIKTNLKDGKKIKATKIEDLDSKLNAIIDLLIATQKWFTVHF